MSGAWLDLHGPQGTRREALGAETTRLGGGAAEIPLAGVGTDQLHFLARPPRVRFEGRGTPPRCEGASFIERALRPGDRLEWAGFTLVYGGEADAADLAPLEEIAEPGAQVTVAVASPVDRLTARVRAGIACELGFAERAALQRWRTAILESRFEPDACARELLAAPLTREAEERLTERAGTLLRDFLMASHLSGVKGAGRKVRGGLRNLVAFLVAQLVALVVFTGIVLGILLVLRAKGRSIDELLDRVTSWVP